MTPTTVTSSQNPTPTLGVRCAAPVPAPCPTLPARPRACCGCGAMPEPVTQVITWSDGICTPVQVRSPRACAVSYPTRAAEGLLWVWAHAGPGAEAEADAAEWKGVAGALDGGGGFLSNRRWFFRWAMLVLRCAGCTVLYRVSWQAIRTAAVLLRQSFVKMEAYVAVTGCL